MTILPDDRPAASSRARPMEIEEPLNRRVIHPLSRRLVTLLIPTGLTPNAVSILGVLAAVAAAAAYALVVWPVEVLPGAVLNLGAFVGFILHLGWHVLDGADGDLARRTGKSSPSGEVVDGICDYLAHIAVYAVLAWLLTPTIGGWAWLLATAAGLSRAVEANHYESARRTYQWWVYDLRWIRQTMADGSPAERKGGLGPALARLYLGVSGVVSPEDAEMTRLHDTLLASPKADAARDLYAATHRPLVKFASWLGALHETQAIFVAMLAGSPIIFFVYELVVLNAVMLVSIVAQRRANKALKPKLAALLAS
jgi:phosphatidylglycerophosphate synthase